MTLRSLLVSFILATSIVAAPLAVEVAHACGPYGEVTPEMRVEWAVRRQVQPALKPGEWPEIVALTFTGADTAQATVQIANGSRRGRPQRFVARRVDGTWSVAPAPSRWLELLTVGGWVSVFRTQPVSPARPDSPEVAAR